MTQIEGLLWLLLAYLTFFLVFYGMMKILEDSYMRESLKMQKALFMRRMKRNRVHKEVQVPPEPKNNHPSLITGDDHEKSSDDYFF